MFASPVQIEECVFILYVIKVTRIHKHKQENMKKPADHKLSPEHRVEKRLYMQEEKNPTYVK